MHVGLFGDVNNCPAATW